MKAPLFDSQNSSISLISLCIFRVHCAVSAVCLAKLAKIGDEYGCGACFAICRQRLKPLSERKKALKRTENMAKLAILVEGLSDAKFAKRISLAIRRHQKC